MKKKELTHAETKSQQEQERREMREILEAQLKRGGLLPKDKPHDPRRMGK